MPSQNHGEERNNRNQETGIGVLTSDYWTGSLVPFSPRVRICASVTVAIEILLPPFCLLPSAQCPAPGAQSAPFPDVVLLGRRFRRTRRPVYPLPRPYRAHRATAAPGDCPAFQREKSLARNIPSGEEAGELASHPCRAPSQHQAGTPPRPPLPIPAFRPPGPRSSLPRTSSRRLLAAWPGLVVRFHLSHLPRFLLSSSSSPSPPATASPASPFV